MLAVALFLGWSADPSVTSVARRANVELHWTAPQDLCPDAEAVLDDALALLGEAPPAEVALRVLVTVARVDPSAADGREITLVLRLGDAADGAERTLRATECGELARAAALLTAMAIDPTMVARIPDAPERPRDPNPVPVEPERPPAVDPGARAPVQPLAIVAPPSASPSSPPVRPRPALHASALLGAGVGVFALPRATADLELGFALARGRARFELAGSWWTPVGYTSPDNPAIGGRFQLGAAVARACFVPHWRTFEFPLCASLHAGALGGRGTGALARPLAARDAWVALGGGPTLLWRPRRLAGRLGVWARTEGLGVLARPAFATAPSGLLWRARPWALVALAGVELRFWSRR